MAWGGGKCWGVSGRRGSRLGDWGGVEEGEEGEEGVERGAGGGGS